MNITKEKEKETTLEEEVRKLRDDMERLSSIMATLTDKVNRLAGIVGALAEQLPDIQDIRTKN